MIRSSSIRDVLNKILAPVGVEVARRGRTPSWETLFERLNEYGFRPNTVFDIGVADGTPWLYKAFPDALFYLIDPARESVAHMQMIAKTINAKILNVALGDKAGYMDINVQAAIGASTVLDEVAEVELKESYPVKVERLDSLVSDFAAPAFCKIDVQGAEGMVLAGMSGIMDKIDVFVIETSLIETLRGCPEVLDVMNTMSKEGFCLYDILSLGRRPLDQALTQVDFAFVRRDSIFRRDKRWAA